MKSKIVVFLLALVSCLALAFGLAACDLGTNDGGGSTDGTYYLYESGEYVKSQYIKLDGENWSDSDGIGGTFTLNGMTIVFYAEVLGSNEELFEGTLSDGVLTVYELGEQITYCKEGKTPSGNNSRDDNPQHPTTKTYTVTYDANGGVFADDFSAMQTVNENALLTAPVSPTRVNYSFGGWATDKNGNTMWKFASDKVTKNITLYAVWKQESAVILSVDNASIEERSIFMLVKNDVDYVSLAGKVVCSDDSIWKLYYDRLGLTEISTKIAAQKSGALDGGDNIFYIVVSSQDGSQVNTYELTIHRSYAVSVNYYDNKNGFLDSTTVYTGNEFNASYIPSITGYTFNGWKDSDGKAFTSEVIWTSLSLYADCTVNSYTVTFDLNGGNPLSYTEKSVTYDSNYSFAVPTRTGYTFLGWYVGSAQITGDDGKSLAPWTYTVNKTITAKWAVNDYNVTLNKNYANGGTVTGAGTYAYDSSVTVTAETNLGYSWLGWYSGETLLTDELSYTFVKSAKNETYTAKWQEDESLKYFYLTSTPTTCSITGVKDKTLTEITVPEYITSIDSGAFEGCTALTTINYNATECADLSSSNYVFAYAGQSGDGITVNIGANVKKIPAYLFCPYSDSSYSPKIVSVVFAENSVCESIKSYAFSGCSSLTSITIPDGVTSIGGYAFSNCSAEILWGNNPTITEIGAYAFANYKGTSITIPDSVTSIGEYAFRDCSSLTSITIPDGVTSIGEYAFNGCSSLTNITIPDDVTSIGSYAFYCCSGLTSVTIGNRVTSIGYKAFYYCTALTEINYNATECADLSSSNYVFYKAGQSGDGITVNIGANVKKIPAYLFYPHSDSSYLPKIVSVVFAENSVCESINLCAFSGCSSLTSIYYTGDIAGWCGISGLGDLMYYSASGRKLYINGTEITGELIIPNDVTSIGSGAFYNCSGLTSITIPEGVTSIGSSAFGGCSGLESIILPFVGDSASETSASMSTLFGYIFGTHSYTGGTATEQYYASGSYKTYYIPTSLKSVTITGGNILYGAFEYCSGLTSITIPDSVTSIGEKAFCGCSGLTSITIPDGVTSIGEKAFYNCKALSELKYNATECADLSSSNYVFYKAGQSGDGITVNIGANVKKIPAYLFCPYYNNSSYSPKIVSVVFAENSVCESIGNSAFYNCTELASIYYTGDIAGWCGISGLGNLMSNSRTLYINNEKLTGDINIPDSVTSIGDYAFYNCTELTSITIPNGVMSIGNAAFGGCSGLVSITLPFVGSSASATSASNSTLFGYIFGTSSYTGGTATTQYYAGGSSATYYIPASLKSVTITGGNILYGAFYICSGLTSITIPDSVTSIGDCAFYNCSSLTSITIPDSVTSIGSSAFYNCTALTEINYNATECADLSGENYVFSYAGQSGDGITVNIGANVKKIPAYLFYSHGSLKIVSVIFAESSVCESIGSYAFAYCTSFASITVPTEVISIGNYAFYYCTVLTEINYNATECADLSGRNYVFYKAGQSGDGITVNIGANVKKIPAYLFYSYDSPKIVSVIFAESSVCESIGEYAFYNCSGLTSITIPDSVTSIGEKAFCGCSGLTSVTIGNGVSSIGNWAFYNCSGLTSIYYTGDIASWCGISGLNNLMSSICTLYINNQELTGELIIPDSVTSIGDCAFSYCRGLTSITIPNSVTSIGGYAFSGCTSLTRITIPDNVTSIGFNAFYECNELQYIYYSGNVESWLSISGLTYLMEYGSSNRNLYFNNMLVTEITIPASVTSIQNYAFYNCNNLTKINFNATNCNDLYSGNYVFYNAGQSGDGIKVTIGANVTKIPAYLFYPDSNSSSYAPEIMSVVFADNGQCESIGSYAFAYCTSLASITIPDGVTSIGSYAFYNCSSLTSTTIPDSVTSIGDYAFYNCTELTSITIPNGVMSIGNAAFGGCSGLVSITLPFVGSSASATSASNSTLFGYIFGTHSYTGGTATEQYYASGSYKTYYIPTSLKSVIITGGRILYGAFYGCGNLTSITILDSITSIGDRAFGYCSGLTSITISKGVTSIGQYAFYWCKSLTSVTFEENSGLTSIGDYAFAYCSALTSITIRESVTSIGRFAFNNTGLTSVTFENTSGWWVSTDSAATSGIDVNAKQLQTQGYYLLKTTYYNYYWKRN